MSTKDETDALKVRIDDLEAVLGHMAVVTHHSARLLTLASLDLMDSGEKRTARIVSEQASELCGMAKHLLRGGAAR
ncbi:hypothetical protein N6H05_01450 [Sphingobium sp. WTD-1]|uniref:hypothetical protein n=1 Tax=Sphingobium sp. WTD-1 TaxID=2979467 RepID=UPI0024DE729E|nr:hypothetical protein [Sphingobium sp. WTD-1]WIA56518.1 hypothetical protein N6H05_01450 [Sphingobium sp. WTD-1]